MMKSRAIFLVLFCSMLFASTGWSTGGGDAKAVIGVVEKAYVQAVHAQPNGDAMRAGFHDSFIMFTVNKEGKVGTVTKADWASRIDAAAKKANGKSRPVVKANYPVVDVSGNAAVVKVELYKGGKHIFSDYLSLYKFEDGWKIVGKIFYRHPSES